DPVKSGIVANLARPGANVTGLSTIGSDLSGKRLELLKEALPGAERVAVLWNRPSEGAVLAFRELELASGQVGVSLQDIGVSNPAELRDAVAVSLQDIGVSNPAELRDAVASAVRTRVAAIMVIDDPVIASYRPQILSLASEAALPLFSIYSEYADDGGLMAYGASLPAVYWRGAVYVDRILRGAKP